MYPYLEVFGTKVYMTGLWIVLAFFVFIIVAIYLIKKWKQDFVQFFYWIPLFIVLVYFCGSYVQFILDVGIFPASANQWKLLLTPYGYWFHFVWILLWMFLSIGIFFNRIKRYENKKIWADIFFYSCTLAIIPLWVFLLLGDDFIWKTTTVALGVQALHEDSELKKFSAVLPIGLFLSVGSLVVVALVATLKRMKRRFGLWMWGFVLTLLMINIVLLFQQYPRYGVMSVFESLTLDIKQYVSFVLAMLCLIFYYKWEKR